MLERQPWMTSMTAPPWIAYPNLPFGSIGWRMGKGEDHYNQFYRFISGLPGAELTAYVAENPEAPGWEGIYERIRAHPWR